jgi:hypothetical protein
VLSTAASFVWISLCAFPLTYAGPNSLTNDTTEIRQIHRRLRDEKLKSRFKSLVTELHTYSEAVHIRTLLKQGKDLWVEHGPEGFEQEMALCIRRAIDKVQTDDTEAQLTRRLRDLEVKEQDTVMSKTQPIEDVEMGDKPESSEA